jgi:hypothetical protein
MEINIHGIHLKSIGVQSNLEDGSLMISTFRDNRKITIKRDAQLLGKEQGNYTVIKII